MYTLPKINNLKEKRIFLTNENLLIHCLSGCVCVCVNFHVCVNWCACVWLTFVYAAYERIMRRPMKRLCNFHRLHELRRVEVIVYFWALQWIPN